MTIRKVLALGASVCALALAQQDADFAAGMKRLSNMVGVVKKFTPGTTDTKIRDQASGAAETIGSTYEEMIAYWRQREAPDAVKWAEQGKAQAAALNNALFAGDAQKAEAAMNAIGATCSACHAARREKTADGRYRFKTPADPTKAGAANPVKPATAK
jgi:hypothetical protein